MHDSDLLLRWYPVSIQQGAVGDLSHFEAFWLYKEQANN